VENASYQMGDYSPGKNGAYFVVKGGVGHNGSLGFEKYVADYKLNISSNKEVPQLINGLGRGKVLHVSIWRQGQRLRVYFNGEKVFDIPRAFEDAGSVRNMRFFSQLSEGDSYFYLGNIRYAVGKADMRSKLVSEGKLVTYGITFDKGKADVKAESYGVLKSISEVLKENSTMKVKIVGHTDADGDADSNMALSKARAEAVSKFLVTNFGVSTSQLVTDGKGESQLLREEGTPDADALNRRVEFIKQ
jgi:flagellar motor protein MotB